MFFYIRWQLWENPVQRTGELHFVVSLIYKLKSNDMPYGTR